MNVICIVETVILLLTTVVLVEQDAELGQLRQTIGQLREEQVKELGRAEKLAEELKGEYFMVRVTVRVISLLDRTFECL